MSGIEIVYGFSGSNRNVKEEEIKKKHRNEWRRCHGCKNNMNFSRLRHFCDTAAIHLNSKQHCRREFFNFDSLLLQHCASEEHKISSNIRLHIWNVCEFKSYFIFYSKFEAISHSISLRVRWKAKAIAEERQKRVDRLRKKGTTGWDEMESEANKMKYLNMYEMFYSSL